MGDRFLVAQYAYLLGRLKEVREGPVTLLDRCLVVYGSGIRDGDRHDHDDLPILLAGRGGGMVHPGRSVRYPAGTPLANPHLSLLARLNISADTFGDNTGRLPLLA